MHMKELICNYLIQWLIDGCCMINQPGLTNAYNTTITTNQLTLTSTSQKYLANLHQDRFRANNYSNTKRRTCLSPMNDIFSPTKTYLFENSERNTSSF